MITAENQSTAAAFADARASRDEAEHRGHLLDVTAGGCASACPVCATHPRQPAQEWDRIVALLRHDLDHPVRRQSIEQCYAINWQRIHALAACPSAQDVWDETAPRTLLYVTVAVESNAGRTATAQVRCLLALGGRQEPYTQETVPTQPSWREATSEGLKPIEPTVEESFRPTEKP
jgi:hypothetical protein